MDKDWAPWLFVEKDVKRIIAALELLATLIAVRLWDPCNGQQGRGAVWARAGTDNQSNSYAVSKMMTTKYPLTLLVMELSEALRTRRCELSLEWIPRDLNQLADDLTNEKFDAFPEEKRVKAMSCWACPALLCVAVVWVGGWDGRSTTSNNHLLRVQCRKLPNTFDDIPSVSHCSISLLSLTCSDMFVTFSCMWRHQLTSVYRP